MISYFAGQFAEQHRGFLSSIQGTLARALDEHDPTTPKVRRDFHATLERMAHVYIEGFALQLRIMTDEVKQGALIAAEADLSEPELAHLNEYVDETVADLCDTMRACVGRDDRAAEQELRKIALNVDLLQSSSGMSKVGALIKAKFGRVRNLAFVQPDRLGRKRASDGFVGVMVRKHLLMTDIETRLFVFAKRGSDLAQIVYADGDKGLVFSITGGTPGYPIYEEIKDSEFHPMSSAFVKEFKE